MEGEEPRICIEKCDLRDQGVVERLALARRYLWGEVLKDGTVKPGPMPLQLGVAFLDGDPSLQKRVREVAMEWTKHAYVHFAFGGRERAHAAQIRISFDPTNGSWSWLGTECLRYRNPAKPTMNFGWLKPDTEDKWVRRVVLHEFGHALGCLHEHQQPAAEIRWNKEKVYAYHKEKDGWTRDEVEQNVFVQFSKTRTVHSAFDPKSIMIYPIPAELTDGQYSVDWNHELSDGDRAFIARVYPRP